MSIWDDSIKAEAAILMEAFGEENAVTFTPYRGEARPISAILEYRPPSRVEVAAGVLTPALLIQVLNDATTGISSAEQIEGGTLAVPQRYAKAGTTTFTIRAANLTQHDAGMLTFQF